MTSPSPVRRRKVLRWVLVGLGVIAAVVGVRMIDLARDVDKARDLLDRAGARIEAGDLAGARADLAQAETILISLNNRVQVSPEAFVLRLVPVLGSNLDAVRDTVGTSLQLVAAGEELLDLAEPLQDAEGRLQVPLQAGALPLETIVAVADEAEDAAGSLPGPGDVPTGGLLLGPIGSARDRVYEEALERRSQLSSLSHALRLIADMAGASGPRRYLLAVANTAEMRGTGGMILHYGVLEGAGGKLSLTAFGPIDELALQVPVDPVALDVSREELERWDGLEVTRLWRNANLVPDLATAAPRFQAMYEAATNQDTDGIIVVDAHGLAAVLHGVGPVTVDGVGTVTADNAVDVVLNQAYIEVPQTVERRELLGEVAEAAFERLTTGDYPSLRMLGRAVLLAVEQRHIEMRADRADAAKPLSYFGADGSVPAADEIDYVLFTLQNFGQNKLDYYMDTSVSVVGERRASVANEWEITVNIANQAPVGASEPPYVFGPSPRTSFAPGEYRGVASLYLPVGATLLGSEGQVLRAPYLDAEDGRSLVAWDVLVPAGQTSTVTLRVQLPPRPDEDYELTLTPLPRVRPTVVDVDLDVGGQRVQRSGPLLVPEVLRAEGD